MEGLLNPFDVIVISTLLISGIVSWTKGFTTEALSLGAWAGAAIITLQGHPIASPYAYELIQPELMADIITYALLGVVSLVVLKLIAGAIGRKIKESHVGALDRGLGILFGTLRGMLLICFIYLLTTPFISAKNYPDWYKEAKSRPLVEYGASMLNAMNPYKDDIDLDETRKDIEALERLKKMMPSFPGSAKKEDGYDKDSTEEMDDLFKKLSDE
ncbi:CvpA family protein [Emcibacter sp.]|uniref:CvpA family protein n=1 Tax=Emcibacter sp. TaxID=1979954 RepID=UPI002AA8DBB0|nr:CvpA family protein [Emcibacter sp.]